MVAFHVLFAVLATPMAPLIDAALFGPPGKPPVVGLVGYRGAIGLHFVQTPSAQQGLLSPRAIGLAIHPADRPLNNPSFLACRQTPAGGFLVGADGQEVGEWTPATIVATVRHRGGKVVATILWCDTGPAGRAVYSAGDRGLFKWRVQLGEEWGDYIYFTEKGDGAITVR